MNDNTDYKPGEQLWTTTRTKKGLVAVTCFFVDYPNLTVCKVSGLGTNRDVLVPRAFLGRTKEEAIERRIERCQQEIEQLRSL